MKTTIFFAFFFFFTFPAVAAETRTRPVAPPAHHPRVHHAAVQQNCSGRINTSPYYYYSTGRLNDSFNYVASSRGTVWPSSSGGGEYANEGSGGESGIITTQDGNHSRIAENVALERCIDEGVADETDAIISRRNTNNPQGYLKELAVRQYAEKRRREIAAQTGKPVSTASYIISGEIVLFSFNVDE